MLRSRIARLGMLLAAVCAVELYAGPGAATLASNQAAAFAVAPILLFDDDGGPTTQSYAAFTNTSDRAVTLHLNFIDGRDWSALDYSCPVTGEETVLFVFRFGAGGARFVDFKCSFAIPTVNGTIVTSTPVTLGLPFGTGLLTVAVESPAGTTISDNLLVGDWLVVDFRNADAYGATAIGFQGLSALAQDGDRDYRFDGIEYATFPAQVASNFVAPTATGSIDAELVLFTLDGTTGGQPVAPGGQLNPVRFRGNVYNDREGAQSMNFSFDCFTIASLRDISQGFVYTGPGGFMSPAGHFELTPGVEGAGDPAHAAQFGTGRSVRRRPALGWLVEHFFNPAQFPPGSPPIPGRGSFARTLGTSVTAFTPLAGDTPVFSSN